MRKPASKYNRVITVQQESFTPDAAGGIDTPTLTTYCRRFAAIERDTTTVKQVGDRQHYETDVLFSMPFDRVAAAITAQMTISYAGKTYKIKSITDMADAHEEIQIVAVESTE